MIIHLQFEFSCSISNYKYKTYFYQNGVAYVEVLMGWVKLQVLSFYRRVILFFKNFVSLLVDFKLCINMESKIFI